MQYYRYSRYNGIILTQYFVITLPQDGSRTPASYFIGMCCKGDNNHCPWGITKMSISPPLFVQALWFWDMLPFLHRFRNSLIFLFCRMHWSSMINMWQIMWLPAILFFTLAPYTHSCGLWHFSQGFVYVCAKPVIWRKSLLIKVVLCEAPQGA